MRYKPLLLFLALLIPPLIIFSGDVSRAFEMQKIKEEPAFTTAMSSEVRSIESKKKNREPTYYVYYKFLVNGVEYKAVTTPTDKSGADKYLSEPTTQIVYYAQDPTVNTLKRYFDLRNNDSLLKLLILVIVGSTAFALPVSLFWSWRKGWLRRGG